jgi:putative transcriptional regulator
MHSHRLIRAAFYFATRGAAFCLLLAPAAAQSHNPKDLSVGRLLVARRQVPDGRFRHAVILLVGLSAKGAAGLVLNEPGHTPLSRLFPKTTSAQARTDVAYAGGPVETSRLFCLLRNAGPLHEGSAVLPGVYASANRNLMHLALNATEPPSSFRVFQGYAGWKPGGLQREIAAGYWKIVTATAALIFDPDPATLWARLAAPPAGARERNLPLISQRKRTRRRDDALRREKLDPGWSGRRDLNSRPLAPQLHKPRITT